MVDVLVILIFYRPSGSMTAVRAFEWFVMTIVFGVAVCFCIELSLIRDASIGEVFRGYLPSAAVVESNGYILHLERCLDIANVSADYTLAVASSERL